MPYARFKQISDELEKLGKFSNKSLDKAIKNLSITDEEVNQFIQGDVQKKEELKWSDKFDNGYIEVEDREDLNQEVITTGVVEKMRVEEEKKINEENAANTEKNNDFSLDNILSTSTGGSQSLTDIMSNVSAISNSEEDDDLEDPSSYVFCPHEKNIIDKGFYIFLKSHWDTYGTVSDKTVVPNFLVKEGFESTEPSYWRCDIPYKTARKILKNIGITPIEIK